MAGKDYLKKIKAALLAGSMAVSLSACGEEQNEKEDVNTTKTVEEVTTDTKTTTRETSTQAKKESKTTSTQEETTETTKNEATSETTNKPVQNNGTSNTNTNTNNNSNSNTNNNTGNTQNNTPSYEPSYAPEEPQYEEPYYEEPYYEEPNYEQETPQYEKTESITKKYKNRTYTKYDIASEDPVAAVYAMRQLSAELASDLFKGYESPKHVSLNGVDESFAIIIALNYDQNINLEMLGHYYYSESNDEFNEKLDMLDLAKYQYDYNSNVDFNKYVLNEDLANFINNISEEYREYRDGTSETLYEEMNNYFEENSDYINDYVKYYFMSNTKESLESDESRLETARQLYYDEVLNPLYNSFAQNRHRVKLH